MSAPPAEAVLLVGSFPAAGSGAFSPCVGLAAGLARRGWRVLTTSSKSSRARRLLDMTMTAWRRRDEYAVAQVDVFSGLAFLWAGAVCRTLRAAGRPYVLVLHGGSLPEFARRSPARVARLLRGARAVTTPSRYLLTEMRTYREDLLLVPNAIGLSDFRFRLRAPAAPRLVWVRAFHRTYNPALAVRTLAALAEAGVDARLTMIGRDKGDGSLEETRRLAGELGVAARLEIPGGVPNAQIPERLSRADVFLNTTNVDNTPVSVLEAMASGLCVVSTNVGGIPHLLTHGKDALLVPPDRPEAMAAAVRRILENDALAARLSRGAAETVRPFDWSAVLPVWDGILREAAREGGAARRAALGQAS